MRATLSHSVLSTQSSVLEKEWSGSLSRILSSSPSEDHSSATRVAAVVEQPTRKLVTGTGGPMTSLFGLAPQGVYRAVAAHAGRGALLPHRFTLASFRRALRHGGRSAVCFLLHFPSCHHAWPLASLLPVRVRTFLQHPSLSLGTPAILRFAPRSESNRASPRKNCLR